MNRSRFIFAAALALVATSAWADVVPIVSTDFSLQDAKRLPVNWTLTGGAGFELQAQGATTSFDVALTKNTAGQAGAMWSNDEYQVPSFTMWADVNVDFHPVGPGVDATCPADGFAMAFAKTTSANVIGGAGGAMGLFGDTTNIPNFIGMEVNTWYGNSIDDTSTCTTGKNVTFAFENINADNNDRGTVGDESSGGARVGQVTAPDSLQNGKLINGGWYRYQWDVDTTTGHMDAYVTGLEDSNKAVNNLKVAEATFASGAPKIDYKGRFGLAAGTGGGTEGVRVRQVVVVSPAVPAGTPIPTAPAAAPTAGQ